MTESQLQEKFEILYRQLQPALVGFARNIIHNASDADEIVNDVFLAVWDKKDQLELNMTLKSYLFTSVKNRCLNHIKKARLQFADMPDEFPVASTDPGILDKLQAAETNQRIQILIDMLPKKCKQVFLLSRLHELSYKEISELMEISPKTVENQIGIALKFLKEGFQVKKSS